MSAPARLLALRLQGFKSFAERTLVEFGPGISAVVGPNGSGKSNLADALRWTLGEQGRSLRTRKSEDVIWAGSERRSALGMADVTLVLDNSDSLLPVDFSVVELGRRLFRSGENDYLLNRQRVRLRDLVDLLDAANLADNAFLFIGQGMVDQALALRPEERRPLFEEVAGVRRPERRRRKAEEQLVESEGNLARVEDILAELRPQARRLAAQAEQQATRATAGAELAEALVLAGHSRWYDAARRLTETVTRRQRASADADHAMAALEAAESAAGAIAAEMGARAAIEQERRLGHETARTVLTDLQLREARLAGDLEAIERDRGRLRDERAAAESDLERHRGTVLSGIPRRDIDLEAALTEADRALAEATAELATLHAASRARGEELAAVRRAQAARQAEIETARRRTAEAERRATEEHERRSRAEAARTAAESASAAAALAREEAETAELAARADGESARRALEERETVRREAHDRLASADTALADLRARLASLDARLAEEETRGIARAARRLGGVRVDEELVVEPALRPAVEAALGDTARAYLLGRQTVNEVAGERGVVVVRDAAAQPRALDAAGRRALERVAELGGGPLTDAIRRDPTGSATAVLARTVLLPDLAACLVMQPDLPAGWRAVPRDGSAVVTHLAVVLGRPDGLLERRAERSRLAAEHERLDEARRGLQVAEREALADVEQARSVLEARRAAEAGAVAARRRAEDGERLAVRAQEAAVREAVWHAAQTERLDADLERLRQALVVLEGGPGGGAGPDASGPGAVPGGGEVPPDAIETWKGRVGDLRARRDRLAEEHAIREAARRDAEARHARAEAAIAMAEERIGRADREASALSERRALLEIDRDGLRGELSVAADAEVRARAELEQMRQADAADRSRLADAERAAAAAREALRDADDRLRAADHAELEARLGIEALREQLLVELAGLGPLGVAQLRRAAQAPLADADPERHGADDRGAAAPKAPAGLDDRATAAVADTADTAAEPDESDEAARLAAALDSVAPAWTSRPPGSEPPTPGRLAHLRRRYHELGAANPFAVEEYDEVRARLAALEAQAADLRGAIASTRALIDELNRMIAEQFAATFRALEAAFDRRFNQLFGGGYAKLSLTDPDDLSASGVDIVARPPGKKAQALAMLSGGERALTAVALLFAMLEVRPVPFCVLDEVDAALDEANVGRFSDALRSLADQTQFIVITHNRGTIEAADALYGVTVGDDSVSRVISLRLDEARAIADRRQEREPAAATVG